MLFRELLMRFPAKKSVFRVSDLYCALMPSEIRISDDLGTINMTNRKKCIIVKSVDRFWSEISAISGQKIGIPGFNKLMPSGIRISDDLVTITMTNRKKCSFVLIHLRNRKQRDKNIRLFFVRKSFHYIGKHAKVGL